MQATIHCKYKLSLLFVFTLFSISVFAQPNGGRGSGQERGGPDRDPLPRNIPKPTFVTQGVKCSNTPASYITYRDVVAADIKYDYYWYMNPENPGGETPEERMRNFTQSAKKLLDEHGEDRAKSYSNEVCHYRGEVKCPGNNKDFTATLTCHDGYELIQSSFTYSNNKFWKSGPKWTTTTLTWVTVGKKKGFTFAAVDAKRSTTAINSIVAQECKEIVKYVNKEMHIPLHID